MKVIVALALCISCCLAMTTTTHRPHHTHEPSEHETLLFHYNQHTNNMVIRQQVGKTIKCFVATLSAQEQKDVHTDDGIRSLELKLLSQLSTGTAVESSALDPTDVKSCGHAGHNGATMSYFTM